MYPGTTSALAWIIVSLGLLGIILSFLVPDRKKSLLAVIMAGAIILIGLIQLSSQAFTRFRFNRNLRDIQQRQKVDLEQLRERLKESADQKPAAPAQPAKK